MDQDTGIPGYVRTAEELARQAHSGQRDKLGADYIGHLARVAQRVGTFDSCPEAVAAAWLHDVLEDTEASSEDLYEAGIPAEVIEAVKLLSKQKGQPLDEYCAGIRADPLALAAKRADVDDNTDPTRTSQLNEETRARLAEKYAQTRALLGVAENAA